MDEAGRQLAGEQVSLTDRADTADSATIATAMTRELEDFAGRIAAGVRETHVRAARRGP